MPQRVLVIRLGRLGDTILATTIIQALQQTCGVGVVIDFAVSPGVCTAALDLDQRINQVFPIVHRQIPCYLNPSKRALRRHSRGLPYDLVFNLECGPQCDDFIEFVHARKFFGRPLSEPRHLPGRHGVDTEKTIYADVLGHEATVAAVPSLQLSPHVEIRPGGIDGDYVIVNPGFSGVLRQGYRSHRRWPDRHWTKLIDLITQSGRSVAINGSADEERCFAALLARPGVKSLFGSPLAELIATIKRARCMISVDTGSMHLATALGIPVIALFGPTNADLSGPYPGQAPSRVLSSGVDCQPCFQTALQKKCSFNRCMQELSPDLVFEELERLINQDPASKIPVILTTQG